MLPSLLTIYTNLQYTLPQTYILQLSVIFFYLEIFSSASYQATGRVIWLDSNVATHLQREFLLPFVNRVSRSQIHNGGDLLKKYFAARKSFKSFILYYNTAGCIRGHPVTFYCA